MELPAPAPAHPGGAGGTVSEEELFGPEFLTARPLLEAIDSDEPVVLLIDEIDRADEEFEAFLLEILSPSIEREVEIVRIRVPGIPERLAREAAAFVRGLRTLDLAKPPGVAETIDWTQALAALGREEIDAEVVEQTLGSVLKYREDIDAVRDETLVSLVEEARAAASR